MKIWRLLLFFICVVPLTALAQISPLPVDQDTVALWNFDTDVDDQVVDLGPAPVNGVAYTTELLTIPNIDPSFNVARKFSTQSSFVDLGLVQGSKLDFTGWNELAIEAVINLTNSANGDHVVFSSENVRLMVINNQLAGFVRQPGGLFGVVSDRTLALNTTYRVGLHYLNQNLLLTINGRVDSSIRLDFGIQAPQFSTSRASIGGDLFARYFPGFVDDVRVRNVVGIDIQGPGIELLEPSSFQVTTAKPSFLINLTDNLSGVDVDSIEVYLNGILQPGISKSESQISGQLDDELSSSVLNEVKVFVADLQGNINQKSFFFTYASIFERQEYTTDGNTLALWHMNDFSPGFMRDDSGHGRNGFGNTSAVQTAEGVFGLGRQFIRGGVINFDSIRFETQKFTLETWLRPTSNYFSEEVIFYNGQIKIYRWNGGFIRVVLYTTRGELNYQSNDILIPVNELHHLAVSWDGTRSSQNITFYVDGLMRGQLDAVSNCDFDPVPKLGIIGQSYEGLIDEMRFSDTTRTVFSVPVVDNQVINFLNLRNGSSVNADHPEFHATLNSANTINVSSLKIFLNGVLQPATPDLVISQTGIDGVFTDPLKVGLNNLEISFLDDKGNQRKKSQYFYYIKKAGGAEYEPEEDTAGLWHFNEISSGTAPDITGNGNDFDSTTLSPVSGVIGNGSVGYASFSNRMPLNCRAFTVESFVKMNTLNGGYQNLYQIGSSSSNHSLRLNSQNGNIQVSINNTVGLDQEVPLAVPVDEAYHHIALVYDGSRSFSQLLLIVDGVVKRSFDFHNSCDFNGPNYFNLGSSGYFSFDELRVSKSAKYSFNLQNEVSDRPVLVSSSIADGETVSESNLTFNFSLNDADGLNTSKTKLIHNGVEVSVQEINGIVSHFSADLNLQNGANIVHIKSQDMKGNEQITSITFYSLISVFPAEYQPDSDTVFLYHMNEESGPFLDSSSSGHNIPDSGWIRSASGVFNGAANNYSVGGSYNYGTIGNNGWTFEFWRKGGNSAHLNILYGNNLNIGFSSWAFSVSVNGSTYLEPGPVINDSDWHHYAVIADPNNAIANLYFIKDGKVIFARKVSTSLEILNLTAGPGYTLFHTDIDEMRFSKIPRYELVSSQE